MKANKCHTVAETYYWEPADLKVYLLIKAAIVRWCDVWKCKHESKNYII